MGELRQTNEYKSKETLDSIDDLSFTVSFILNKRGRKLISPDVNIMS